MFFKLQRTQLIKADINTVWDFFTKPENLKAITPDYMGFDITSEVENKIYPGQIITYKVKPLFNIPIQWMTEITQVANKEYFIDEQRFGPYSLWHHKHFFKETANGIEMTDIVDYKIPAGIIGVILHKLFIKKRIEEIFNYRYKKLERLFNEKV